MLQKFPDPPKNNIRDADNTRCLKPNLCYSGIQSGGVNPGGIFFPPGFRILEFHFGSFVWIAWAGRALGISFGKIPPALLPCILRVGGSRELTKHCPTPLLWEFFRTLLVILAYAFFLFPCWVLHIVLPSFGRDGAPSFCGMLKNIIYIYVLEELHAQTRWYIKQCT
jgi:hypothetical protein